MKVVKVVKVVKRNGERVPFDGEKIKKAIENANRDVDSPGQRAGKVLISNIVKYISERGVYSLTVEEIQNMIEDKLMEAKKFNLVKQYIIYREKHSMMRATNTTDQTIKELLDGNNEYWNTENSNKNARLVTTRRDYIAGITSTDLAGRMIFPKSVIKAHDERNNSHT